MDFSDLLLSEPTIKALKKMGIVSPTEIQEAVIPEIIANPHHHILAQAKTGTGKTLAFGIPLVELLDNKLKKPQAVIIVPTRELCKQVADVFRDVGSYKRFNIVQIYGGVSISNQMEKIEKGAQIIVATPGRLIDLSNRGIINFDNVKFVVLDEADRCLDMGFFPDIEYILKVAMAKVKPRLWLFSATLLYEVQELAAKFTNNEATFKFDVSEDELTVENCDQFYYLIPERRDKYYHFVRILRKEKPKHSIIFVNTKKTADWLYDRLSRERGLRLRMEVISGNLSQKKREIVLSKFKDHKINVLIATDVAARGLDIPHITHVFNYDLPDFAENYVHRIGRTARINESGKASKGIAITLALQSQYNLLCRIEGYSNTKIIEKPLPQRKFGKNNSNKQYNNNSNNRFNENHRFNEKNKYNDNRNNNYNKNFNKDNNRNYNRDYNKNYNRNNKRNYNTKEQDFYTKSYKDFNDKANNKQKEYNRNNEQSRLENKQNRRNFLY